MNTICPVVPDACGKRSASVSMPCWDSVPGIVKSLISLPPIAPDSPNTSTASRTPADQDAQLVPGDDVTEAIQERRHGSAAGPVADIADAGRRGSTRHSCTATLNRLRLTGGLTVYLTVS